MSVGKGHGVAWDAGDVRSKSPRIKTRSVACPTCGAGTNESCINQGRVRAEDKGKLCASPHPARKRMATRAFNARREAGNA